MTDYAELIARVEGFSSLGKHEADLLAALKAVIAERDVLAEQLQSAMMDGHDMAKNEYRDIIAAAEAEAAALRARVAEAHEAGMDEAADKILAWLAKAVGGEDYSPCDGTEEWDGDVRNTVYAILKAGGVYDDEDGRVAKLSDRARVSELEGALGETAEQELFDEMPGYVALASKDWHAGFDAAINYARAALRAKAKE